MSESDSGTDPIAAKPKISKLKLDGRPVSQEEEARIMALPEVQREELLADRANVADREKQNRALMQLLKERERKDTEEPESPDRKRRSAAADVDDTQKRRSTRQKTAVGGRKIGETSAPMEAYRRERAQKGAQAELKKKRSDEAKDKGRAKDHGHSEADADGESESEWDGGQRAAAAKHVTPQYKSAEEPPELVNYNYARIGRTGFGEVCFYPEFFDVINGCFVRINIGNDPKTGEPSYRMAQIKGTWVTCFMGSPALPPCPPSLEGEGMFSCRCRRIAFNDGPKYNLDTPAGVCSVKSYAVAAHGKAERPWPYYVCSNSNFTEVGAVGRWLASSSSPPRLRLVADANSQAEFDRYKRVCAAEGVDTPSKSFLLEKNKAINAMLSRTWTEEELQQKLERSGVLEQRIAPILRRDILDRRVGAIARADEAAVAQCDKELAELDGPKNKATAEEPEPKREPAKQERTQSQILEEVNRRNRRINAIAVRKAQLEERAVRMRGLRKIGPPDEKNKGKKKEREQRQEEGDGASAANGDDGETAPPCPLSAADIERLLTPAPQYNVAGYKMISSDVIDYSQLFAAIDWGIDSDIDV